MHRSFALALTIAAAVAVQIYIISQPHEHPCPPTPLSFEAEFKPLAESIDMLYRAISQRRIKDLERELAATKHALLVSERKRWLQNADHGK